MKTSTVVAKPRVPEALLQVIRSKKGGAMRDKRMTTRSTGKRELARSLMS